MAQCHRYFCNQSIPLQDYAGISYSASESACQSRVGPSFLVSLSLIRSAHPVAHSRQNVYIYFFCQDTSQQLPHKHISGRHVIGSSCWQDFLSLDPSGSMLFLALSSMLVHHKFGGVQLT